jgi:hypothetical protein
LFIVAGLFAKYRLRLLTLCSVGVPVVICRVEGKDTSLLLHQLR